MIFDEKHEECGVFGIYDPGEDVSRVPYFALYALQHRGQESAGIATYSGKKIKVIKRLGLVSQIFNEEKLNLLDGDIAIAHTRYSTTGSDDVRNASPFVIPSDLGDFAIAHNGNITNTLELKKLLPKGIHLKSTTDSEILGYLIATREGKTFEDRILEVMKHAKGAYSVTLLAKDSLYAFRDPLGFRPLSLAKINSGYAFSSETCAFGTIGARRIRDIEPGEIVRINKDGLKSFQYPSAKKSFCIFEYVYFSRPDSIINGQSVYTVRERLGGLLAKTCPKDVDLVMGVPDSGIPSAIGLSVASGVPYREGFIKNRYIGRTFINPDQVQRLKTIKLKLNALRSVITDKNVVLVDDSIVRGNTMKKIVGLLKEKGAKSVHVRITCPAIMHPCFFGVDFPSYKELAATTHDNEQIREMIGADSLEFISLSDLVAATSLPKENFCLACFNGEYPYDLNKDENSKYILE